MILSNLRKTFRRRTHLLDHAVLAMAGELPHVLGRHPSRTHEVGNRPGIPRACVPTALLKDSDGGHVEAVLVAEGHDGELEWVGEGRGGGKVREGERLTLS